ncbi:MULTISPECIES: hypothetical protein [Photorhabdus]|uniref:hypothetical protein n=1 Tax=Photorhabdus TaxID=29487 RepID=UPI000B4CCCEB|nr:MULTISPECIES: hypothetical protein [Photorhabdus]MCT8342896.1 hypothetical protein [Photorhabdus kleinii]OWO79317.1 hypothetical protein B5C26_21310 [Photorhabdus luminescens]RAX01320.1 hypothetical protein CKY05_06550 [Photorhabdus sp. S10-54]RAX02167.1 hypothetical protein CKY03_04275 [Photorhabdus sp. S9-53]RAX04897.1 hypothetical protein CKY04_07030 [Photorhabdus sp. S8-52]
MQSTAQKLFQPIFTRKAEPIKLFSVSQDDIGFEEINQMIIGRIKRDADLLMSVSESIAHI